MRLSLHHSLSTSPHAGKALASWTAALLLLSFLTGLAHSHSLHAAGHATEPATKASSCGADPQYVESPSGAEPSECAICQQQRRSSALHPATDALSTLPALPSLTEHRSWCLRPSVAPAGSPRGPPRR